MTTESPRLAVHVFGAGKGESIVLRLPNGRWGVVDCYAKSTADPNTNPTLQFLKEQGATELEFLCLTHPHDDHFRGMSQLLEAFPVDYFWRSNGLSGQHFLQLVEYLQREAEEIDKASVIEGAREFVRIFGLLERKRTQQQPPLRQKRIGPTTQLYPVPFDPAAPFQIIGLGPSGNQVDRYNRGLLRCFNERGEIQERMPQAHHNIISAALLVIHGRTRIVLGGDMEREGWRDAIDEIGAANLAANAVKISHHGSSNGYCDGLWAHHASRGEPIGIVTAYVAQQLPRRAALDHIVPHTDRVLTTCITALRENQLPSGLDPATFRSLLALMMKMGRLSDETRHQCGRCTLIFDDQGQCVDQELAPPADQLPAESRPAEA